MSMVRHSLLYLLAKGETQPRLAEWPELSRVDFDESDECYLQNFCMGGPFEIQHKVISLAAGDDYGLRYVHECVKGTHVLALRGLSDDDDWYARVNRLVDDRAIVVCDFDRHDIVAALGRKAFWDGIELLQESVRYLRSPAVHASPNAMRTETALTRAIESLCTTGYCTPKRR